MVTPAAWPPHNGIPPTSEENPTQVRHQDQIQQSIKASDEVLYACQDDG